MSISVISSGIAVANTITLGTHASGDLIIAWAYRGSVTPPTVPSGWTLIQAYAASNNIGRYIAIRTATSGAESFGTWTNATIVGYAVLRSSTGSLVCAGSGNMGSNTLTINYASMYLRETSGRIFVMSLYGNTTTDLETPPTGYSLLDATNDGTREVAHFISDSPGTAGSQTNQTLTGTQTTYGSVWVEVVEVASAGGLSPQLINSQTLVRGIVI